MNIRQQLIELLEIHGISGNEEPVRDYLEPILKNIMDETIIDNYGNLLGILKCGTGKGATVLLSAHMDTVRGVKRDKKLIEKDGIIRAILPNGQGGILGADDRAGIAIILEVLKNIPVEFNGIIKASFSREEEIGCRGADRINSEFLNDVDLAIVVDRKGNRDIVVGCGDAFCNNNVGYFMEYVSKSINMDWKCVEGNISDAVSFSSRGVNSINISAGYQNEHTTSEFVSINNMNESAELIKHTLEIVNNYYKDFGEVPYKNQWISEEPKYEYQGYHFEDNMIWEEEIDDNGDVYAYSVDGDIVLRQGIDEVRMNKDNMLNLFDKILSALEKREKS